MERLRTMHNVGVVLACLGLVLYGFLYGVYLCRIKNNSTDEEDSTWQPSKPRNP